MSIGLLNRRGNFAGFSSSLQLRIGIGASPAAAPPLESVDCENLPKGIEESYELDVSDNSMPIKGARCEDVPVQLGPSLGRCLT